MKARVCTPCAVKWCTALAAGSKTTSAKAALCVVHGSRGELFHTLPVTDDAPILAGDCPDCDGTGECETCEGEGEHRCDNWRCHALHDCGACDGTGKCEECDGTGFTDKKQRHVLDTEETEYLNWATWSYQPPSAFTQPWDTSP